jgi:hypothetical protein
MNHGQQPREFARQRLVHQETEVPGLHSQERHSARSDCFRASPTEWPASFPPQQRGLRTGTVAALDHVELVSITAEAFQVLLQSDKEIGRPMRVSHTRRRCRLVKRIIHRP